MTQNKTSQKIPQRSKMPQKYAKSQININQKSNKKWENVDL